MLDIELLTILHEQIRDPARLRVMVPYAAAGGYWTADARRLSPEPDKQWWPILIARFPDGLLLLHDGHHRAVATWLAGRRWLDASEYEVTDRTYDELLEPNPQAGWYTPLDPRTECRVSDYWTFRETARTLAARDPAAARAFIRRNRSSYACPRTITRVSELAGRVGFTNGNPL